MFGDKVVKTPSYERCTRVDLPGGIYQLRFLHAGKHQPDSNRSIRVQVDPPSPPLTDSSGNPVAGYWAIEMDPAIDPQHKAGRLRAQPPFQDLLKRWLRLWAGNWRFLLLGDGRVLSFSCYK
jgi:hypothetical protein